MLKPILFPLSRRAVESQLHMKSEFHEERLAIRVGALPFEEEIDVSADGLNNKGQDPGIIQKTNCREEIGDDVEGVNEVQDGGNGENDRPPGDGCVLTLGPRFDESAPRPSWDLKQTPQPACGCARTSWVGLRPYLSLYLELYPFNAHRAG